MAKLKIVDTTNFTINMLVDFNTLSISKNGMHTEIGIIITSEVERTFIRKEDHLLELYALALMAMKALVS